MALEDEVKDLVAEIKNQKTSIDALVTTLQANPPSGGSGTRSSGSDTPSEITIDTGNSGAIDQLTGDNSRIANSFAKMTGAIEKFTTVGKTAVGGLDEFGRFGRAKYDIIQDQFGGIADINNATTETSKKSVEAFDDIFKNFYSSQEEIGNLAVVRNGERINALSSFYKNAGDISANYMAVRDNLAMRQSVKFNEMSREDVQKLSIMEKGLKISNSKVAELLERQISTTGKASTKIFDEISAHSHAVSKATGVSYQEIAGQITNIITDVERFGNVQVDEAARIAGALNQLGLSYQGFGGMVDKFMNFDNAAESLGNLTTVFGVHFDAMEMMQLANEDQEEFLYRMREAFLDSGKAVEDMTLAEKKLAAQQMGMSIQDFENFMQEDRVVTDLTEATDSADVEKGFQNMTDNMKVVQRTGKEMEQFMINKVMDPLSKQAYTVGNDFAVMKNNLIINPEKFLPGYQEFATGVQASIQATIGDGAFDNSYKSQLDVLNDIIKQGDIVINKPAEFQEKVNKALEDGKVSYQEFLKIVYSPEGGSDIIAKGTQLISEQTLAGIEAASKALDTEEIQKKIQSGIAIDPDEMSKKIKEQFDELAESAMNDFSENPMAGRSPSPAFGIPIIEGVLDGFSYLNNEENLAHVKSSLMQFGNNVSEYIKGDEANAVLGALLGGKTTVEIENNTLVEKLQNLSNDAILEHQESQRINQEKTDAVVDLLEGFMNSFKSYLENPKVIENKLEIDGKTLAAQLMKIKTDGGTSFALVNPGGDSV